MQDVWTPLCRTSDATNCTRDTHHISGRKATVFGVKKAGGKPGSRTHASTDGPKRTSLGGRRASQFGAEGGRRHKGRRLQRTAGDGRPDGAVRLVRRHKHVVLKLVSHAIAHTQKGRK